QLPQLLNQGCEVGVASSNDEGGDVLPFETEFDGVYRELDVGRVLARGPHTLGNLDEFDVASGKGTPFLSPLDPVGVGPADDDPAALGQGVGDRLEVERDADLAGADREVVEVEKERDPFFVAGHARRIACEGVPWSRAA